MKFPRTIRWRLQVWLGLLLAILLAGFGFTAYQFQKVRLLGQLDEELEDGLATLMSELRGPPRGGGDGRPGRRFAGPPRQPLPLDRPPGRERGRGGPPEISDEASRRLATAGLYFAVWSPRGDLVERSESAPGNLERPSREGPQGRPLVRVRGSFREIYHVTPPGDVILVGASTEPVLSGLRGDQARLWAAGLGVLGLGLAGCWWITTRSLRPVSEIGRAARRIAEGDLAERIAIDEPRNELGELAAVLNETFSRLDESFAQQVRFTSDASHELRTPLALMISEAQTTLARERSAEEYRESLGHCLESAQRMRALVAALLDLARLDSAAANADRTRLDLAEATAEHVQRFEPVAREAGCRLESDLQPAEILASESHLALIVANLVSNAIHYSRPEGRVRVTVRPEEHFAILAVEDKGVGIEKDALPRIFDRFFRADASRSNAQGRVGLGLSICRAAVLAEGGTITVESRPGAGSVFIVRLPLASCTSGRAE